VYESKLYTFRLGYQLIIFFVPISSFEEKVVKYACEKIFIAIEEEGALSKWLALRSLRYSD
jgi:hypothetical protein